MSVCNQYALEDTITVESEAYQVPSPGEKVITAKPSKGGLRRVEEAFLTASTLNSAGDATQGCSSPSKKLKQVTPDNSFSQAYADGVICSRGNEANLSSCETVPRHNVLCAITMNGNEQITVLSEEHAGDHFLKISNKCICFKKKMAIWF